MYINMLQDIQKYLIVFYCPVTNTHISDSDAANFYFVCQATQKFRTKNFSALCYFITLNKFPIFVNFETQQCIVKSSVTTRWQQFAATSTPLQSRFTTHALSSKKTLFL
jgi:hypothetical protein